MVTINEQLEDFKDNVTLEEIQEVDKELIKNLFQFY